ncbi:MAG: PA2779 family protein [Gammaproteobacteria bacterium]|nr:PA2779 family protein [Gammaproteobacteria bacterium]
MKLVNLFKHSGLVALIACLATFVSLPAQSAMLGTADMIGHSQVALGSESITTQRQWIQSQLEANGVGQSDAMLRVSSLSDSQVQQIHQRIDELPAGASTGGIILFGFLVLLITDLTGLTDVFPFIRPLD